MHDAYRNFFSGAGKQTVIDCISFDFPWNVHQVCYQILHMILVKKKLKIDDALDAFLCYGIGGIWGVLLFGDYRLFIAQILGIVITIAVAVLGTVICAGIVRLVTPLRVTVKE